MNDNNKQSMRDLLMKELKSRLNTTAPEPEVPQDDPDLQALQESQSSTLRNIGLLDALNTAQQGSFGKQSDSSAFDPAREQAKQGLKDYLARRAEETKRQDLAEKLRQNKEREKLDLLNAGARIEEEENRRKRQEEKDEAYKAYQDKTMQIKEEGIQLGKDRQERLMDRDFNNRVERYGKMLKTDKLPQLNRKLRDVNAIMSKPEYSKDIPGFGLIDSLKPQISLKGDALTLRKALVDISDMLMRSRSGAQINVQELKRFNEMMSARGVVTEEQLRQGVDLVNREARALNDYIQASFPSEVRDAYHKNLEDNSIPQVDGNSKQDTPQAAPQKQELIKKVITRAQTMLAADPNNERAKQMLEKAQADLQSLGR